MTDRQTRQNRVRGEVEDRYDVVVVGAGLGGLVAAAGLAREGRSVLILDQHYIPGGNATVFRRKEWVFDVGLHYVGGCHPGGSVQRALEKSGVEDIVFRQMDSELEVLHFPDFTFTIPADIDEFERRLHAQFPEESKGIRRFLRLARQTSDLMKAQKSGSTAALLRGARRGLLFPRYALGPLRDFLDSCTDNEQLRAILTAQNGIYAIAPGEVSTILHMGVLAHYFESGGWYPEGGGQRISDRLAEEVERAGGQLRLRSQVTRIITEGGRVTGVRFINKHLGERTIHADAVISNADLKRTVTELFAPEQVPRRFRDQVAGFSMALPLSVVFLGLDISPDELPWGNSNVWLFDSYDFDECYAATKRGDDEALDKPWLYISTASLKDPDNDELAPAGHTNLELMTIVPPDASWWGTTPAEIEDGSYSDNPRYQEVKERLQEACITQMERLMPDVRDHIVYRETCSPMTHQRYVRSSDGTSYGFAGTAAQFMKRPGAKSPVKGLYLAGTNTRTGHGIAAVIASGRVAAKAILSA